MLKTLDQFLPNELKKKKKGKNSLINRRKFSDFFDTVETFIVQCFIMDVLGIVL